MCRRFIQILCGIVAVIALSIGVSSLIIRTRIMDENTYFRAAREQNGYTAILNLVSDQANNRIPLSDQSLIALYREAYKAPEVSTVLQTTFENTTSYIFQWLRGEQPDLYVYIPATEIKSLLAPAKVNQIFTDIFDKSLGGYDSWTACTNDQEDQFAKSNISLSELHCRLKSIPTKQIIQTQYNDSIYKIVNDPDFQAKLDQTLGNTTGKVPLQTLTATLPSGDFTHFETSLQSVRNSFYLWGVTSVGLIIMGVLFTLITLALSKMRIGNLLAVASLIAIFSGLIMAAIGALVLIFSGVFNATFMNQLTSLPATAATLVQYILNVGFHVIGDIVFPVIAIGVIAFVIGLVVRIVLGVANSIVRT